MIPLVRAGTAARTTTPQLTLFFESKRGVKFLRRQWLIKDAARKSVTQRDSTGKPVMKKKEKMSPLFTPLPVEQLKRSVFRVDERAEVEMMGFTPGNVTRESVGSAMEFVASPNTPMKHYGLPKTVWKDFRLLSKPCSVIRSATVDVLETLGTAGKSLTSPVDRRMVLTGQSGCGKSYMLLQAAEWCAAQGWIVIYVPRAVTLVNSTTPYTYDLRTQTFFQPEASYQILQRAKAGYGKILKELKMQSSLVMESGNGKTVVAAGKSLYELVDIPKEEVVASASVVLDKLMEELRVQTKYPVLLAVDDFQALFARTAYRDPRYKPIASYHLQVPRMLLEFASGRRSFAKGAFVGALNASDPVYGITPELGAALDLPSSQLVTTPWPYVKHSRFLYEYAQGMKTVEVPTRLSVQEAGTMFEVWMRNKVLGSKAHDELFMAKYVESGGNARDFVWKGLLGTLQS